MDRVFEEWVQSLEDSGRRDFIICKNPFPRSVLAVVAIKELLKAR